MKYTFPDDFLFGASLWATGTEGAAYQDGKSETVWDKGYKVRPKRFYNGVGPDETLNMYHDYPELVKAVGEMGLTSYRTSILWARLLPDGHKVNQKAADFYRNMFKAFKQQGVYLSVVLYWFDMPAELEDRGGFCNREIIDDFLIYCKTCFELFDGLVDRWFIYNEPVMDAFFKYQMGVCYPFECDLAKTLKACYNMVIAHREAVKLFREGGYKGRVGSVLNQSVVYPRNEDPEDLKAKEMYELFNYRVFEDPLLKGELCRKWMEFAMEHSELDVRDTDEKLIRENRIDFLGINVYLPVRVMAKEYDEASPIRIDFAGSSFHQSYIWPERRFNKDRGWEIYPEVVYDLLISNMKQYPELTMMITENGIGIHDEDKYRNEEGVIQDDYRIDFIREHLEYVSKALEKGINLIGYNVWSLCDLWSPTNQFKNTYGLYEYDRAERTLKNKKSVQWYSKIIKNKEI